MPPTPDSGPGTTMKRRDFALTIASASGLRSAPSKGAARITKISFAPIEGRHHKFVAMNSHSTRPGGVSYTNTLVRIGTDQGVEGLGVMDYSKPDPVVLQAAKTLVGA